MNSQLDVPCLLLSMCFVSLFLQARRQRQHRRKILWTHKKEINEKSHILSWSRKYGVMYTMQLICERIVLQFVGSPAFFIFNENHSKHIKWSMRKTDRQSRAVDCNPNPFILITIQCTLPKLPLNTFGLLSNQ